MHTGQHYDEAMSEGQILATRLPRPALQPRRRLAPARASSSAWRSSAWPRLIEAERPDAVHRPRRHQRDPLGRARGRRRRRAADARRGRPALAPHRHARGAQPRSRPTGSPTFCSPRTDGARAQPAEPRACRARSMSPAIRSATSLECWRDAREARPMGDYVLATVHRNYNTDDPARLQAVLACLGRSPWPVVFPVHPRTRARIAEWRLAVSRERRAGRSRPVHAHARARARRAGDRDRLRWRPARGLPVGRPLRDAARGDRVGRHGRRPAGTRSSASTPTRSSEALDAPAARPSGRRSSATGTPRGGSRRSSLSSVRRSHGGGGMSRAGRLRSDRGGADGRLPRRDAGSRSTARAWSRSPSPTRRVARERIGRRPIDWFSDYRGCSSAPDIDAVCICAPSEPPRPDRARRDRRRQARVRREADRDGARGRAADGRRRARRRREADGGPHRALQPRRRQARRADRRGPRRAGLPRPRHPRGPAADPHPGRRRHDRPGHARPRHHAVRPRAADHAASTPRAAGACTPARRT